jgi:hypothetical protein
MPSNAKWGRVGWGRTAMSSRTRTPVTSFPQRQDPDADYVGTYGIRFVPYEAGESAANAAWLTAVMDETRAGDESTERDE